MKKFIMRSQGLYYLLTGIWPIVHIYSFMAVTGPKTDLWLVKMVGLLAVAIGIEIIKRANASHVSLSLNYTTAVSFLVIDCYYALNDTISDIYLLDGVVQLLFIILLIIASLKDKPSSNLRD